jgi:hypothetical protein
MSVSPRWSYAQARLQARHGFRLAESEWHALEAARALDQFIERARATSLHHFAQRLNARMTCHAIERALRMAWRDYVAEVAGWGPADWRPAVMWTAYLPMLPAIDAILRGERPDWVLRDPDFAVLADEDMLSIARGKFPLWPLLPEFGAAGSIAQRWIVHWRTLWPHGETEPALSRLAETIAMHVTRLGRAGPQETSAPYRRELARSVTRLFRRHGGRVAAVFCHLVLVALDFERLRGNVVRRALFQMSPTKEAA